MKAMLVAAASVWMVLAPAGVAVAGQREPGGWGAWLDGHAAGFSGSVLIARGNDIAAERAYGLADRAAGRKNTAATKFNLGSINKTFTAVAIAQLMQEGRLSLDDTLAKVLPDYPNRQAAAKITIQQLLSHRSGIATFMRPDFADATVANMTARVGAEPQVFEPDMQQQYSNGGYIVLGRIVEVLSGRSYADYVAERVYKPAGMTSTGFLRSEDAGGAALAYSGVDAQGRPMMGPNPAKFVPGDVQPGTPAGGGYSTAVDLFRFSRALKDGRLLDARMTEYLMKGTFGGGARAKFGFALREQILGDRRFIGNGGGAPGINAEFRFEPAGDYTVVVLSNASPPSATQLLGDILSRIVPAAPAVQPPAPTRVMRPADGQTPQSSLRREIEALHADMIAALADKPESVARFYTADARIMGGGRRFVGDQVPSYWKQTPPGASWTLEILDMGGSATEPWVLGRSTLQREGGQAMTTDYVAVLRRGADGKLKYYIDMFTMGVR